MPGLGALLEELEQESLPADWRTKWQRCSERFWDAAGADPSISITDHELDRFIELLSKKVNFSLARLVIVELREMDVASAHPQQQRILEETSALRRSAARTESTTQEELDSVLYTVEKGLALDIELHRARVLLHYSGAFGSDHEENLRTWLQQHPAFSPGPQPALSEVGARAKTETSAGQKPQTEKQQSSTARATLEQSSHM